MSWLLGALKYNDDYETIRDQITENVMRMGETDKTDEFRAAIIVSLVSYRYPAGKPDFIDAYEFSIDKEENQRTFNMGMMLPILRGWENRQFQDQVASKALEHLMVAYAEEIKNLND